MLGFCVPVLPFALTAPGTFYRSVIIAQLVRNDIVRIPQGYRLQQILGLVHVVQLATPPLVIIGIVVVLLLAAVAVLGSRLAHSRPPALDWFVSGPAPWWSPRSCGPPTSTTTTPVSSRRSSGW